MRRRWATLLLALVSASGAVVLVDIAMLLVHGPVRILEQFYEVDARFGYRMRPNAEFTFANPYHGYSARVRTNTRGLRDDAFRVPKPQGVFRIVLLGDSMTAGLEVNKNETFESVCERRLRVHGNVEIINAGVRGYNLDNILRYFEHEGASFAPDVVVYLFVCNDLTSSTVSAPEPFDRSRGYTVRGALGRLARYSHVAFRLLYVRQMVQLRRERDRDATPVRQVSVPDGLYEMLRNPDYCSGVAYGPTAIRIAKLATLSEAAGADFLLVGTPHRVEIDPRAQAWWTRYLARDGVRLDFDGVRSYLDWVATQGRLQRLDPVPEYRALWQEDHTYWFHKDDHLNVLGHALLGNQLADHFERTLRFQEWRRTSGVSTH